jgi:hypothetical protein
MAYASQPDEEVSGLWASGDSRYHHPSRLRWYKRRDAMTGKPTLVLITLAATLGYLGLAILGWGGVVALFSEPVLQSRYLGWP